MIADHGRGEVCEMNVSIGILAHNEEQGIGATLRGLAGQSLFQPQCRERLGVDRIQVACIPNGCTDGTALRAGEIFAALTPDDSVRFEVRDLAMPGKSRSWNEFVHSISDPAADYLVLMDADIEFGATDVIEKLIRRLESDAVALVATDRPMKRGKPRQERSLQENVSRQASAQIDTSGAISGQLYCARSSELRRIWMPLALPVEDGFLAAMISTDGFTVPGRPGSIVQVPDAFHYYDDHGGLADFIRHESRIIVGSVINAWLFRSLWRAGRNGHVGVHIRDRNLHDPAWLDDLVKVEAARFRWSVPLDFLFKRMAPLSNQPLLTKLKRAPVAMIATLLEIVACVKANHLLRQSNSTRFW